MIDDHYHDWVLGISVSVCNNCGIGWQEWHDAGATGDCLRSTAFLQEYFYGAKIRDGYFERGGRWK